MGLNRKIKREKLNQQSQRRNFIKIYKKIIFRAAAFYRSGSANLDYSRKGELINMAWECLWIPNHISLAYH